MCIALLVCCVVRRLPVARTSVCVCVFRRFYSSRPGQRACACARVRVGERPAAAFSAAEKEQADRERAQAMLRTGMQLEALARRGDVRQICAIVSHAHSGDLIPWYSVKMFVAACRANRLGVLVFMVEHDFDPRQAGVDPLHQLAAGCNPTWTASEVSATVRWLTDRGDGGRRLLARHSNARRLQHRRQVIDAGAHAANAPARALEASARHSQLRLCGGEGLSR